MVTPTVWRNREQTLGSGQDRLEEEDATLMASLADFKLGESHMIAGQAGCVAWVLHTEEVKSTPGCL